jgi:uncharacterized protein (TIGR03437 family)
MKSSAKHGTYNVQLIVSVAAILGGLTGSLEGQSNPSVTLLYNNYSGTKPGLPNYGISPGSLFVIVGSNLATSSNTSEVFPLAANLNGTSVSVTVNGSTTQPTLYYVLPTQIAAVLPEGTPAGSGTLTVSSGGATSQPFPIQVVQSAFGILTENGAGFGPAAAFDTNYTPIAATHPAIPGELIAFWGTGVGPDPANDDKTEPQQANNLTGLSMQVYIGGVSATVFYKGRSAYPGVDEVFVYVPAAAPMGCYVSVVMVSGTITSNYATIPLAPEGASSCTDQVSVLSGWQALAGKSSANVGTLEIVSQATQTGAQTQTSSGATAQFKTDNAGQIYSELFSDGLISVGSCIVDQGNTAGSPTVISAGPNLVISGPGGLESAFTYTAGGTPAAYMAALPNSFIPASGGTFTFSGSGGGGGQIGSFNTSVTIPPPITWTNMAAASSIVIPQGFTLNWTGGTSNGLVSITGDSVGAGGVDVKFECLASAASGTFTVPPQVLLSLPNTATTAKLGLASFENPVTFSAPGLDLGFAYGGFVTVTNLANYQTTATPAPQVKSVTLSASPVPAGGTVQATVLLSGPAPPPGVTVTLSSSSTAVTVPSSVTIPVGATSATFTVTVGTASPTSVTITATFGGTSSQVVLTVNQSPYNGTYSGSYTSEKASGTVTGTINDGTLTITSPADGTGTITADGQIAFGVVVAGSVSCNFTGQMVINGASVTGNGTFSCSGGASGTWSMARQ